MCLHLICQLVMCYTDTSSHILVGNLVAPTDDVKHQAVADYTSLFTVISGLTPTYGLSLLDSLVGEGKWK